MDKLKIEYISLDNIKTYENNAKLHPAEQVEQIKKSIQEFGFNDPIAIDENNVIIEGHGRYIACKELGIKEVPIIRLNNLDEEHKRAYMLVHNKLTMNSDFDIDTLNFELEEISLDMSEFGFEVDTLNVDELGTDFELPNGNKEPFMQITYTLATQQAEEIKNALSNVRKDKRLLNSYDNYNNDNDNGNALYVVVKEWEKQKI